MSTSLCRITCRIISRNSSLRKVLVSNLSLDQWRSERLPLLCPVERLAQADFSKGDGHIRYEKPLRIKSLHQHLESFVERPDESINGHSDVIEHQSRSIRTTPAHLQKKNEQENTNKLSILSDRLQFRSRETGRRSVHENERQSVDSIPTRASDDRNPVRLRTGRYQRLASINNKIITISSINNQLGENLTSQFFSFYFAVVLMLATSEPPDGSVEARAAILSPFMTAGATSFFIASLPCAKIGGKAML